MIVNDIRYNSSGSNFKWMDDLFARKDSMTRESEEFENQLPLFVSVTAKHTNTQTFLYAFISFGFGVANCG